MMYVQQPECFVQEYGEQSYWETRYRSQPARFDWYHQYAALRPLIDKYCPRDQPLLQIGVGLSTLQDDMADDGYTDILSVDYAQGCIDSLRSSNTRTACTYQVADCRAMPELAGAKFAAVIDKGTLDGCLCGARGPANATQIIAEVARVLQPGGVFLLFSYGTPGMRLEYLNGFGQTWDVETYIAEQSDANAAGTSESDGPAAVRVWIQGPYTHDTELSTLQMNDNVVFAYVCHKCMP